jgi:rfaE bifunctional protein nucleotidyltransferase chain/domain
MLWKHADLIRAIEIERMRGNTIALANGCFDLFHAGHAGLFEIAAREADIVVAALDSDTRVRALKGPDRPLCPLADRARVIGALRAVHYVTSFATLSELDSLFDQLRPDVLVKGAEYRFQPVRGNAICRDLVFVPQLHSSSRIARALNSAMPAFVPPEIDMLSQTYRPPAENG